MIEDQLTQREMQVAALIAEGREFVEIGALLGVSAQTVKNHSTAIYRKLGLTDPKRKPSILLTRMVMMEQFADEP